MARGTPPPLTWLAAIRAAGAGFTAEARPVADVRVAAGETAFRGQAYRVAAEVVPLRTLFGPPPAAPAYVEGETARAPDERLDAAGPGFPPDALRQRPYWDYARLDARRPVLVLTTEPATVRPLTGAADDLPDAVALVRHWIELPAGSQRAAVFTALAAGGLSSVAYVAGFALLEERAPDLPALFDDFAHLPGRPGAAIQGIVDGLRLEAGALPEQGFGALAQRLLAAWPDETDPAALSAYLLWFDAHRQRVLDAGAGLAAAARAQAKRVSGLEFSGPGAEQWMEQVRYYASVLLRDTTPP